MRQISVYHASKQMNKRYAHSVITTSLPLVVSDCSLQSLGPCVAAVPPNEGRILEHPRQPATTGRAPLWLLQRVVPG